MITYDSEADGNYVSEHDRAAAGLPILRESTKRVGTANGGVSQAKHVTKLPFDQFSDKARDADTFTDFPNSLMSVGKTSDDGTISIFTKDGVTVHKEEDVLITCKGMPILVGVRDEHGRYRIPLMQQRGRWAPRQPKKNDGEMIRAYDVLVKRLQNAGVQPKKHVLDNEISENMKQHIRDQYKFTLELVPPGCHRRNAAEVAIRNFKAHFLSVLAGTADNFPNNLWDRLLPQTEIALNLLRQSNATPTVSAYAHLCGPFDYNKMPLAPMGCEVQVHEKTDKRGTWAYHSVDGWYL
ncbi:hypothetical protein ACHAXN_000718 [Cyclotella atomus]